MINFAPIIYSQVTVVWNNLLKKKIAGGHHKTHNS